MLHGQQHLDHTGHPGCALGMTDVGFHRPDNKRPFLWPMPAKHVQQSLIFNGISQSCSRTMGFHVRDVVRHDPS